MLLSQVTGAIHHLTFSTTMSQQRPAWTSRHQTRLHNAHTMPGDSALADSRASSTSRQSQDGRRAASRSASPGSRIGLVAAAERPASRDETGPSPPGQGGKGQAGLNVGAGAMPWYRLRLDLENAGSVARDHLANERTWLGG